MFKSVKLNNSIFDDPNTTLGVEAGTFSLLVFGSAPPDQISVIRLIRQAYRYCALQAKVLPLNQISERLKLLFDAKKSIFPVLSQVKTLCQKVLSRMTQQSRAERNEHYEVDALLQQLLAAAMTEMDKMDIQLRLYAFNPRVSATRFWTWLQYVLEYGVSNAVAFSSAMSHSAPLIQLQLKQQHSVTDWLQHHVMDFDPTKLLKKRTRGDKKKNTRPNKKLSVSIPNTGKGGRGGKKQVKAPRKVTLGGGPKIPQMKDALQALLDKAGEEWDDTHCTFMAYNGKCTPKGGGVCSRNHNCVYCGLTDHKLADCAVLNDL